MQTLSSPSKSAVIQPSCSWQNISNTSETDQYFENTILDLSNKKKNASPEKSEKPRDVAEIFAKALLDHKMQYSSSTSPTQASVKKHNFRLKQMQYGEVLTTNEVMEKLKEAEEKKVNALNKKTSKEAKIANRKISVEKTAYKSKKQKLTKYNNKENIDLSEDSDTHISLHDNSSSDIESVENLENDEQRELEVLQDDEEMNENDFVLVRFIKKQKAIFYVGQIKRIVIPKQDYDVQFLRKKDDKFVYPSVKDEWGVERKDIIAKMPQPRQMGSTTRTTNSFIFDIDLSQYKVM